MSTLLDRQHFILVKTGGRKFRCMDCDAPDPFQLPEINKLLTGELRRPQQRLRLV
jgi:hypothetical protein